MCDPMTALMVAGTALKAGGSVMEGNASAKAAKENARQAEYAKIRVDQKAAVDVDAASREFALASGANQARIGASGVAATSFYDILADDAAQAALEVQKIYYDAESEKSGLSAKASAS